MCSSFFSFLLSHFLPSFFLFFCCFYLFHLGFTYRRTLQRHVSGTPKWTKKKRPKGNDEDEEEEEIKEKRVTKKKKNPKGEIVATVVDTENEQISPVAKEKKRTQSASPTIRRSDRVKKPSSKGNYDSLLSFIAIAISLFIISRPHYY
jgi:hypothetical protein